MRAKDKEFGQKMQPSRCVIKRDFSDSGTWSRGLEVISQQGQGWLCLGHFQTTPALPGESSGAPGKKMIGACFLPGRIGFVSRFFFFNLFPIQGPLGSGAPWPGRSWIPHRVGKRAGVGGQETGVHFEG